MNYWDQPNPYADGSKVAAKWAMGENVTPSPDASTAAPKAAAGGAAAGSGAGTAALIALQLYSQAKKAEFADKQARYKSHLDQRNAQMNALDSLIGVVSRGRIV